MHGGWRGRHKTELLQKRQRVQEVDCHKESIMKFLSGRPDLLKGLAWASFRIIMSIYFYS